jgi:hypothetical protein
VPRIPGGICGKEMQEKPPPPPLFDNSYRRFSISGTKKAQITLPLRQFFPLIEVLL